MHEAGTSRRVGSGTARGLGREGLVLGKARAEFAPIFGDLMSYGGDFDPRDRSPGPRPY